MTSSRIGIGALVLASALYAAAGQADTGKAGSPESQRSKAHVTGNQRAQMDKKPSARNSSEAKERTASGEVKSIDAKALTLANGEQLRLGSKTEFMNGSKKVSRQDVKQGERIRASYEPRGNLAYADRIEIISSGTMQKSSGTAGAHKGNPAGLQK